MFTIRGKNVNDVYFDGLHKLLSLGEEQSSRAGDVVAFQEPVTLVYERPQERVLFDEGRVQFDGVV